MNYLEIIARTRRNVNDVAKSLYDDDTVKDFLTEGLDRVRSSFYFQDMEYLVDDTDVPIILPEQYHYILCLYAGSKLFAQDERHYEASADMNSFEYKFEELISYVENGDIILLDELGEVIDYTQEDDNGAGYVVDVYFNTTTLTDLDEV